MSEFIISILYESLLSAITAFKGLFIPAIVFSILAIILKPNKYIEDFRRALPEITINIEIMIFNVIFVVPAIVFLWTFLSEFVRQNGMSPVPPELWAAMPNWLVVFIAVLVGDFVGYWRHRLEHTALLWPSHAIHHSDEEMTWTAIERFHPINRMTTFLIDSLALLLLGMPPFALIVNGVIRHYYGAFIHSDLPWTYGILDLIFVSPAMHRWHHAADPRAFETNFSTVFTFWDRAFGTYRVPGPCDVTLGVTDEMQRSLTGQLSYPFQRRAYRRMFGKKTATTTVSKRQSIP